MATVFENLSDETRDQLAGLALKLSGNQKTRKGFLGLVKEVAPETPVPELDTEAAVQAAIGAERAERQKFEQEMRDQRFKDDLERQKRSVMEKYQLSDEDLGKMEKMMTEKTLPADYNWAAQLFKQQSETAEPTNYGSSGHGPVDLKNYMGAMDGLIEDPDNWALKSAHSMIDNMRRKGAAKSW